MTTLVETTTPGPDEQGKRNKRRILIALSMKPIGTTLAATLQWHIATTASDSTASLAGRGGCRRSCRDADTQNGEAE